MIALLVQNKFLIQFCGNKPIQLNSKLLIQDAVLSLCDKLSFILHGSPILPRDIKKKGNRKSFIPNSETKSCRDINSECKLFLPQKSDLKLSFSTMELKLKKVIAILSNNSDFFPYNSNQKFINLTFSSEFCVYISQISFFSPAMEIKN